MEKRIVDIALQEIEGKVNIVYTYQDKQNKTSTEKHPVYDDGNYYIEKKITRDDKTQTQKFYIVEDPPTDTSQDYSYHIFLCEIDFERDQFSQEANFYCAEFSQGANFLGAEFSQEVNFGEAQFSKNANFRHAKFPQGANFGKAEFSKEANFFYAEFSQEANFGEARFSGEADFYCAEFSDTANFRKVEFSQEAGFWQAQFNKANFEQARFSQRANFGLAQFSQEANFHGARFFGKAYFREIQFSEANFSYADFENKANFDGSGFYSNANFSYIEFQKNVYFTDCTVSKGKEIDFSYTVFEKRLNISFPNEKKKLEEGEKIKLNLLGAIIGFPNYVSKKFKADKKVKKEKIKLNLLEVKPRFVNYSGREFDANKPEEGKKIKLNLLGATIGFLNYAGREFDADKKETFILLKAAAIKQRDQITALGFHKQEMEAYCKECLFWRGPLRTDKAILIFEKITSYFGTKPLLALFWVLVWNGLVLSIYYYYFDAPKKILPYTLLFKPPGINSLPLSFSVIHFFHFLGNVFLSYEFVKSLRKFSRKL